MCWLAFAESCVAAESRAGFPAFRHAYAIFFCACSRENWRTAAKYTPPVTASRCLTGRLCWWLLGKKLDGSPQVTSRQQPINVAFYVPDGTTFASANTRFHNIQLSFQSHLRAQLMTRGNSHQTDPLGQMSVEARCMLMSSAQIPRTFLQPDFRKADKTSFLEEPEMAEENKAAGIPL